MFIFLYLFIYTYLYLYTKARKNTTKSQEEGPQAAAVLGGVLRAEGRVAHLGDEAWPLPRRQGPCPLHVTILLSGYAEQRERDAYAKTCMYLHMYICIYIRIHIYVCVYLCTYLVCMNVCAYVCRERHMNTPFICSV